MDERNRQNQGSFERMGEQIGSAAGRAMGRGTEMAMGAMTSMLGSAMDAMGQWWSTADAARAAQSFDDTRDQTCRQHFQSTSSPMSSPSATTRGRCISSAILPVTTPITAAGPSTRSRRTSSAPGMRSVAAPMAIGRRSGGMSASATPTRPRCLATSRSLPV